MILSDKTLMKMLDEHTLIVDPLEIGQIQPASIDMLNAPASANVNTFLIFILNFPFKL